MKLLDFITKDPSSILDRLLPWQYIITAVGGSTIQWQLQLDILFGMNCARRIDISISIFFTLSIEDEGIIYVGPLFLYDLSKRAFLYFYYLIKYI